MVLAIELPIYQRVVLDCMEWAVLVLAQAACWMQTVQAAPDMRPLLPIQPLLRRDRAEVHDMLLLLTTLTEECDVLSAVAFLSLYSMQWLSVQCTLQLSPTIDL